MVPSPGFVALSDSFLDALGAVAGTENVITDAAGVETLSKDYYWYSPVLKPRLEGRRASAAVKIDSLAVLREVVSLAVAERVPLTVRGAATGNYGQSIPLFGGLILDLSGFSKILSLADGVVTAEPGARLGAIENAARPLGWELRCYPSTWVKATVAGFLAGGSGGIGSISWGGLGEPGTIKRMTLLTAEATPRLITLEEADTLKAFHAYGTNGILVEVQLRLAPAYPWDQLVVAGADFRAIMDFADLIARDTGVRKRLVTVLENPIPSFFKPIKKFYPPDLHLIFFEVESTATPAVKARAEAAGLTVPHVIPHYEPRRAPMLSDYTWNHTTLWAIKADPRFTYLQVGYRGEFRDQIAQLQAKFPGEILFHIEFTSQPGRDGGPRVVGAGGIPLVLFTTEARLREIIDFCGAINVGVADPHSCYLEEGWRGADWTKHATLKAEADPHGLLNPGKFKTYPNNPFAATAPGGLPVFLYP